MIHGIEGTRYCEPIAGTITNQLNNSRTLIRTISKDIDDDYWLVLRVDADSGEVLEEFLARDLMVSYIDDNEWSDDGNEERASANFICDFID